jgi:GNAT superfamily N-acetyltransferase
MNSPTSPKNIVYLRGERMPADASGAVGSFATSAWMTDLESDGAYVAAAQSSWPLLWQTFAAERAVMRVEVSDAIAPDAPSIWFAMIDEPKASPRAMNLVAFATDARPAGTVVNHYQFATMRTPSELQVAAVRWYPRDGLVHQVYVSPEWRRQQVGSLILYSAGAVHQSMGWPGKLHSDGRRTTAGDALTSNIPHPVRIAPLSETMPNMDPEPT